jgi:hypothetical protein
MTVTSQGPIRVPGVIDMKRPIISDNLAGNGNSHLRSSDGVSPSRLMQLLFEPLQICL